MTLFQKNIRFCAVFLLIFGLLLPVGRGAHAEEKQADETEETLETAVPGVMLSGIKLPASNMTEEERGMMQAVQAILNTVECRVINGYYYSIAAENVTEYDLHCQLRLLFFDEETLIGNAYVSMSRWDSGDRISRSAYAGDWLKNMTQVQAAILYQVGTSYYQTDYQPLSADGGSSAGQGDRFTVKLAEDLPMRITSVDSDGTESVFEIRSFRQMSMGSTDFIEMTICKISGPDYDDQALRFRAVRDDGVVVAYYNESQEVAGLQPGETMLCRFSCYLDPGDYTLEFVDMHDAYGF